VLVRDRAVRQDHAVLAARLNDHWLILENGRSELLADFDASNFTPLFAIDHRGVQLFAATYAKRPLLAGEAEAAPAAASNRGVWGMERCGFVQRRRLSTQHAAAVDVTQQSGIKCGGLEHGRSRKAYL
jgi:hypothetical protein